MKLKEIVLKNKFGVIGFIIGLIATFLLITSFNVKLSTLGLIISLPSFVIIGTPSFFVYNLFIPGSQPFEPNYIFFTVTPFLYLVIGLLIDKIIRKIKGSF